MNPRDRDCGAGAAKALRVGLWLALVALGVCGMAGCSFFDDLQLSYLTMAGDHQGVADFVAGKIERGDPVTSYQLMMLCDAMYKAKRYDKLFWAADLLDKNIEAGQSSYMSMDYTAVPSLVRGAAYLDMGQHPKARKHALEARSLVEAKGPSAYTTYSHFKIDSLQILGIVSAIEGDREQMAESLRELAAMQLNYPLSVQRRRRQTAISRIHMAAKNFEAALAAVRHPDAESRGPLTSAFVDWTFEDIPLAFISAKSLYETGQSAEAEPAYRKLLSHPATGQFGQMHWVILYDMSRIERARNRGDEAIKYLERGDEAIKYLERAVEIIERQRSSIHSDAGRIGFVGDKQAVYHEIVSLLVAKGRDAEALQYVERAKARALVDLLASQGQILPRTADGEAVNAVAAKLAKAEHDFQALPYVKDTKGRERTRGVIVGLKEELAAAAPELASLVAVTDTAVGQIQKLLAPDEALVEFYYTDEELFVFVMTTEGITAGRLARAGLEDNVRGLRKAVSDPSSTDCMPRSQALYGQLIRPAIGLLGGKRLIVVPHGLLHYIPFGALHSGREYVIDRHSIRILPSASVLKFLKDRKAADPSVLALGNPDLGDPKLDLPSAQEEAISIAGTVKSSKVLLRKDATETFVKDQAGRFAMLHFATHGTFYPDKPLNSALLLARDAKNDGRLSVAELYGLRLNADLVTLSGCKTALGKVANGDDVVGFTRGLLYAGTSSIVSGLWNVPDKATRDLMVAFYRNLADVDKQEALRRAQLQVKRTRPHPYYWAAFVLTGRGK